MARGAAARPRQSRPERPRVWRELWIFCELFCFFPSFLLDVYTFLFIIKNLTPKAICMCANAVSLLFVGFAYTDKEA